MRIFFYLIFVSVFIEDLNCELNYHDQKIWRKLAHNIQKHWTAVLSILGLISIVYPYLPHWRSNQ